MRSSKKKLVKKGNELVLKITIEDDDSEMIKKLNRIFTTQKLLTKECRPT